MTINSYLKTLGILFLIRKKLFILLFNFKKFNLREQIFLLIIFIKKFYEVKVFIKKNL